LECSSLTDSTLITNVVETQKSPDLFFNDLPEEQVVS